MEGGTERNNETKYIALLLLAVVFLSTGGGFVRIAKMPSVNLGFYRTVFALPPLFLMARKSLGSISKRDLIFILLGGVCFGFDLICWNTSFKYTTIANATLFTNMTLVTVLPVSYFVFKEKLPKKFFLGIAVTFSGIALLLSAKMTGGISLFGDGIAFLCSVFYSGFLLLVYKARDRVPASAVMFVSTASCSVTLFFAACIMEGIYVPTGISDIYAPFAIAMLSQVVGQTLVSHCLGKVRASLASGIILIQPALAAVYSFFLFGESLGAVEVAGLIVTSIGVYILKESA